MNKGLIFLSLIFLTMIEVTAQGVTNQVSNLESFNGQLIRVKKNPTVEGSQYFGNGDWFSGTCIAPTGARYANISMRYDSYDGVLEVKTAEGIIAVDRTNLNAFEYFTVAKSGDTLFYNFKTFRALEGKSGTEYLQVLTDSEKIKLLVRRKVIVKETGPDSYGGGSRHQFQNDDETFISINNKVEVVRRNQKFFMTLFPDLKDDIKKFMQANNTRLDRDKDIAALCLFLSSRI